LGKEGKLHSERPQHVACVVHKSKKKIGKTDLLKEMGEGKKYLTKSIK